MESSDKNKKISILIADDDENISKLISMECEEEGYSVDVVSDGQQAILKLRNNNLYSLAIKIGIFAPFSLNILQTS